MDWTVSESAARAPLLRATPVLPPCGLWKTHQDALGVRARRHQAELGAAIVYQVELGIAPATKGLPSARRFVRTLRNSAAAEDGKIQGYASPVGGPARRWARPFIIAGHS